MPRKSHQNAQQQPDNHSLYSLDWPQSTRWNPNYSVPRNSFSTSAETPAASANSDSFSSQCRLEKGPISEPQAAHHGRDSSSSFSYFQSRRDVDTADVIKRQASVDDDNDTDEKVVKDSQEGFSHLTHWLETLAELYMNDLDNRARWDPRWLNITRRERFQGLSSSIITIIDHHAQGDDITHKITTKHQLASVLHNPLPPPPPSSSSSSSSSSLRIILVSDLSRFIMGVLGQIYCIDPEFWFQHLANSGYAASDSGLKIKNAMWLNWAEGRTRFRHRALPEPGEFSDWDFQPRRKKRDGDDGSTSWGHVRWGRLGLMNYLGRKGFHEDEIDARLGDGRWVVERDVVLDKYGLLMTKKRQAQLNRNQKKREMKKRKRNTKGGDDVSDGTSMRSKTTNVYRAYSTFDCLPRNPAYWLNRDLRVMAPEGVSWWSGKDEQGNDIAIVLFDPTRQMKDEKANQLTPSLTFMPRAMEREIYTDDELWRTADPDETYLDPPPPPVSKVDLRRQKKDAAKLRLRQKRARLLSRMKAFKKKKQNDNQNDDDDNDDEDIPDYDSVSSYTSDSEYDEEYQSELRQEYLNPGPIRRDRDFARKYSMSTHNLFHRHIILALSKQTESPNLSPLLHEILTRISLDDSWQLLSQIRLDLNHLDDDLAADTHLQLLESAGNLTRQNLNWTRTTLRQLHDWTLHNSSSSSASSSSSNTNESSLLLSSITSLRSRSESTLSLLATSIATAQSNLVISQTSGINKLTELAFFFIPISFITAVFSMQVHEINSSPPRLYIWALSLLGILATVYTLRTAMRSPSLRVGLLHCRATIATRFSSSSSSSYARELNTVGNRAIAKFALFAISLLVFSTTLIGIMMIAWILLYFGIWLGAAGTALYFIITRWPEPAVLVPCFLALPLAGMGMRTVWWFSDELEEWAGSLVPWAFCYWSRIFPAHWTLDSVDDDDLAKEGVNTYARQAIVLAT